ncbi:MAG: HEPN domain-containing protein [Methylobacter sp.]|nr:HEPN domain-containing protein [Methylobacter sp.]
MIIKKMIVDLEQSLSQKEIRVFQRPWAMLCKKQEYFLPKTIEDLRSLPSAEIKINGVTYFFTNKLNQNFRKIIDTIYAHSAISEYFCYETIYLSVLSELERTISNNDKNTINTHLTTISSSLNEKLATREFYFLLTGLKFKGINHLTLSDTLIFNFEASDLAQIIENRTPTSENDDFNKNISEFVTANFLGETCIKVSCFGDCEKSEQIARSKARLILNYFRFLFCIVAYERVHENLIKISMKSEVFLHNELFFYQSEPEGNLTYSTGKGRRNLQDFELDEKFLTKCKENVFLNDFFDFAFKKDKTELENSITTAIYWIGEAQADFDSESSFLKYWISLESIFTSKDEKITEALCKGVSTILAHSPYRFIETDKVTEIYNKVNKLYKLRCKIVHRGNYEKVKEIELIEMCKLSWQTVLSLFCLRNINYTCIAQVEEQINHLFKSTPKASNCSNIKQSNQEITAKISALPEPMQQEVLDFIELMQAKVARQTLPSKYESALLSRQVLAADWDRPEEDEAWASYQ